MNFSPPILIFKNKKSTNITWDNTHQGGATREWTRKTLQLFLKGVFLFRITCSFRKQRQLCSRSSIARRVPLFRQVDLRGVTAFLLSHQRWQNRKSKSFAWLQHGHLTEATNSLATLGRSYKKMDQQWQNEQHKKHEHFIFNCNEVYITNVTRTAMTETSFHWPISPS